MKLKIATLEEVDIRKLWEHEQYGFSAWLAQPDKIEELNKALGTSITDVQKEVNVQKFRCDLVGINGSTDEKVIIENQLEMSDHDHLGKIITYASGLDAKIIIWIVKEAREEHRSAIEWLNNNTAEDINFFLVEVHAYKIGNSDPAVKFEIIEQPNDFIKSGVNVRGEKTISQKERFEFWTLFNKKIEEQGKPFNIRRPTTDHWYSVAIGFSRVQIDITLVNREHVIEVKLNILDNKDLFDYILKYKKDIEDELCLELDWRRTDDSKSSEIAYRINGLDFNDHSNYSELMIEIIEKVIAFKKVFPKHIKKWKERPQ